MSLIPRRLAGWGPWLIAGATAARRRGIRDIRLHGVEADPTRYGFMQTHFSDNGFDPAAHRLDNAAIGVKAGLARWPKLADPTADWGARPLEGDGGGSYPPGGTITFDYMGRAFDETTDVEVLS